MLQFSWISSTCFAWNVHNKLTYHLLNEAVFLSFTSLIPEGNELLVYINISFAEGSYDIFSAFICNTLYATFSCVDIHLLCCSCRLNLLVAPLSHIPVYNVLYEVLICTCSLLLTYIAIATCNIDNTKGIN